MVEEAAYGTLVLDTLDDTVLNDEILVLDCTSDVADEGRLDNPTDEEPIVPEDVGEALELRASREEELGVPEKGGKLVPVVEDESADNKLRIPATAEEGLITLEEAEELLENAMINGEALVIPEDAGASLEISTPEKELSAAREDEAVLDDSRDWKVADDEPGTAAVDIA